LNSIHARVRLWWFTLILNNDDDQTSLGHPSTAQIARKNWKAIHNTATPPSPSPAGNWRGAASSSRLARPRRRWKRSPAAGSYEALLASPEVDAVYIPLPTGLRKEWVLRAAEAGKHIVCEKPCATSVPDLREMLDACRRHRVQFMDGVMFMHSRRLDQMRAVLDDGVSVGQVKRITSTFSFRASEEFFTRNIRANSVLEPYGCLGDLGWYCLRFALWVMRGQRPRRVTGRILGKRGPAGPAPVPTEFSGEHDHGLLWVPLLLPHSQRAMGPWYPGLPPSVDFVLPFWQRSPSG
jgi:predicted dehydrogenase